jgi:acyl-coenzyme A synthetase/AMP-(fatty) acid ligase
MLAGVPDETRGEVVKAFVVLTPSYQHALQSPSSKQALADELKAFVKVRISLITTTHILALSDAVQSTLFF